MGFLHAVFATLVAICRGVVSGVHTILGNSSDPETKRPLLAGRSAGLKKRSRTLMGMSEETVESPLPEVLVKLKPIVHLPHSLPVIRETFLSTALQIVIPFFVAGFGMVAAGIYLDMVASWEVFIEVPEIIVLVPALLGLKGNLEMTFASRLSTEANLGNMDSAKEQWKMITANLVLVQCQAIVVGLLASVVSILMVAIKRNDFDIHHTTLLCAGSTLTASIASFFLGLVTAAVIILSKKMHVNPDNIATPIAGSLGDITSLALLSIFADFFYTNADKLSFLPIIVIMLYIAVMPFLFWISKNNKYTKTVLYTGWTPVICAMIISTVGGMVLDVMVNRHKGVAVFQPVINGVGGNLVSIQASRLSTNLHRLSEPGTLPTSLHVFITPWHAFFSDTTHALSARVLIFLMVPGQLTFAYTINYFQFHYQSLSLAFVISYLGAATVQVVILLYAAYCLTHALWIRRINPDNSTIPYLTAIGDLLGIILLGLTFEFLSFIKQPMIN